MDTTREQGDQMTARRQRIARALIGGVVGLLVGSTIALLLSGFRIVEALIAMLWALPFIIGLTIFYMRERRGSS